MLHPAPAPPPCTAPPPCICHPLYTPHARTQPHTQLTRIGNTLKELRKTEPPMDSSLKKRAREILKRWKGVFDAAKSPPSRAVAAAHARAAASAATVAVEGGATGGEAGAAQQQQQQAAPGGGGSGPAHTPAHAQTHAQSQQQQQRQEQKLEPDPPVQRKPNPERAPPRMGKEDASVAVTHEYENLFLDTREGSL